MGNSASVGEGAEQLVKINSAADAGSNEFQLLAPIVEQTMQKVPKTKLNIAIVGGGIGGLTFAVALGNFDDLQVDIYETAPTLTERGAGLTLWERGWQIIKHLGIEQDMSARLQQPRDDKPALAFEFRKGDQEPGLSFYQLFLKGGPINYHRADIQSVLLKHISPACRFHLSHRLESYTESPNGVSLTFHDGTTATCDILIAADGIKSVARRFLMQGLASQAKAQGKDPSTYLQCIDPFYSGSVAYRGLVRSSVLQEHMPNHRTLTTPTQASKNTLSSYWGKNKVDLSHLIVYPISQGRLVNVVAFCSEPTQEDTPYKGPWAADADKDELLRNYAAWEDEVRVLLKCMDQPTAWAIHAVRPLPTYVSRRVVLLGDAAHAMTPHQGAGASQAIEDAYILAAVIKDSFCTAHTVPQVLQAYNSIRQPFANRVQAASRHQGRCYEFSTPSFDHIVEGDKLVPPEALTSLLKDLIDSWEWQWKESAEADRLRALGMLRSMALSTKEV